MSYCTQENIVERFGQVELDRYASDDFDIVDAAKVAQAIADASETIDMYIASVVTLPISPVPGILVKLCADIARYNLQDDNPLDEAKDRYTSAIQMLRDISSGKASLGSSTVQTLSVSTLKGDDDRVFTRDTLAGF